MAYHLLMICDGLRLRNIYSEQWETFPSAGIIIPPGGAEDADMKTHPKKPEVHHRETMYPQGQGPSHGD